MVTPSDARVISAGTSISLDLLRIVAALVVVIFHTTAQWFEKVPHVLEGAGHSAVVVFFVLSGYVIAYTTHRHQRGLRSYAQARLSRLSSVVLPALLLTAVIGWIVRNFDPALSDLYSRGAALPRYVLSGLFLNEIWFFSAAPPINRPLWSLSFEFWYYAIFGLWWFRGKGWKSFFLPLIACVMAGPKILLMMPIWLMGGAAFYGRSPACSPVMARTLIAGGLLLIGAAVRWLPQMPAPLGLAPFFFANQFVTDWIIGVLVAGCLWPLPAATSAGGGEVWGMKTIRNVADLTFAIYVLHHPLLVLFRALVPFEPNDGWQALQAGLAVIAVASLLGVFLEWQRPIWVKLFKRVL